MADTLPPEKWGLKESADWWSAGQARRQQTYGAATEMMLELAGVQAGSRVLDVAAGTGDQRSWRLDVSDQQAMYLPRMIPLAC